jgi:hypothetical protein
VGRERAFGADRVNKEILIGFIALIGRVFARHPDVKKLIDLTIELNTIELNSILDVPDSTVDEKPPKQRNSEATRLPVHRAGYRFAPTGILT